MSHIGIKSPTSTSHVGDSKPTSTIHVGDQYLAAITHDRGKNRFLEIHIRV
jgi:hypothetical protein